MFGILKFAGGSCSAFRLNFDSFIKTFFLELRRIEPPRSGHRKYYLGTLISFARLRGSLKEMNNHAKVAKRANMREGRLDPGIFL